MAQTGPDAGFSLNLSNAHVMRVMTNDACARAAEDLPGHLAKEITLSEARHVLIPEFRFDEDRFGCNPLQSGCADDCAKMLTAITSAFDQNGINRSGVDAVHARFFKSPVVNGPSRGLAFLRAAKAAPWLRKLTLYYDNSQEFRDEYEYNDENQNGDPFDGEFDWFDENTSACRLHTLRLDGVVSDSTYERIACGLSWSKSLRVFEIGQSATSGMTTEDIQAVVIPVLARCRLEELAVDMSETSIEILEALEEHFQGRDRASTLLRVTLHSENELWSAEMDSHILKFATAAALSSSSLQSITLTHKAALSAMAPFLQMPNGVEADLNGFNVDSFNGGLHAILMSCTLSKLSLAGGNHVEGNRVLEAIAHHPTLTSLRLSGVILLHKEASPFGIMTLSPHRLSSPTCTLKSLRLEVTSKMLHGIYLALSQNRSLTEVNLHPESVDGDDDHLLSRCLCDIISQNRTLRVLRTPGRGLHYVPNLKLATALTFNDTLTEINFSTSDDDNAALCGAFLLSDNSTLVKIDSIRSVNASLYRAKFKSKLAANRARTQKQELNWSLIAVAVAFVRANMSTAPALVRSILPLLAPSHTISHMADIACRFYEERSGDTHE